MLESNFLHLREDQKNACSLNVITQFCVYHSSNDTLNCGGCIVCDLDFAHYFCCFFSPCPLHTPLLCVRNFLQVIATLLTMFKSQVAHLGIRCSFLGSMHVQFHRATRKGIEDVICKSGGTCARTHIFKDIQVCRSTCASHCTASWLHWDVRLWGFLSCHEWRFQMMWSINEELWLHRFELSIHMISGRNPLKKPAMHR